MQTEHLEYFKICYQTRSYSLAAKRAPMSYHGMTKAMQTLEKEFGVSLFEKDDAGGLRPTPYADELYSYAIKWACDVRELNRRFASIRANLCQEVRIGASLGTVGTLGTVFLPEFKQRHPDIGIFYSEMSDKMCDKALEDGLIDLAFTMAPYRPGFLTVDLFRSGVSFWVHESHPLSGREKLVFADFDGQNVAIVGDGYKCFDAFMKGCRSCGAEPSSVYEISEIFRIYEYVLSGRGLGFIVSKGVDLKMFTGDSKVSAVPIEGMEWRFGLSCLAERPLAEHERIFWNECLAYCERAALLS